MVKLTTATSNEAVYVDPKIVVRITPMGGDQRGKGSVIWCNTGPNAMMCVAGTPEEVYAKLKEG